MTINVLDLFSGIGGMSLAVHEAIPRSKTVGFCDKDPRAKAVVQAQQRLGGLHARDFHDDVTTLRGKSLPKIHMVTAGFPCTDISVLGHREGLLGGSRSVLIKEVFRLVRETKAPYIFLENVSVILKDQNYAYIPKAMKKLGYDCAWGLFTVSSLPGALHVRKRWFLLGKLPDAPPLKIERDGNALIRHLKQKTRLTRPRDSRLASFQSFLLGNTVVPAQAHLALVRLYDMLSSATAAALKRYDELDLKQDAAMIDGKFYEYPGARKNREGKKSKERNFTVIPPAPIPDSKAKLRILTQPFTSVYLPTPRTNTNTSLSNPTMTKRTATDLGSMLMSTTLFRSTFKHKDDRRMLMISDEFLCKMMGYPKHWLKAGYKDYIESK